MTGRRFLTFIAVIFVITGVLYYFTTPQGNSIPLIGVVDGNEVVVSPQITGRIINLTVDEGSAVQILNPKDPALSWPRLLRERDP